MKPLLPFSVISPSSFFVSSRKTRPFSLFPNDDSILVAFSILALAARTRNQLPSIRIVSISLSSALRFSAFSPRLPVHTLHTRRTMAQAVEDVIDTREPASSRVVSLSLSRCRVGCVEEIRTTSLLCLHLSVFLCACAHFVNCDAVYSSPPGGRSLNHSGKVDANRISDSSNVPEAKLEIA